MIPLPIPPGDEEFCDDDPAALERAHALMDLVEARQEADREDSPPFSDCGEKPGGD